MLSFEEKSQFLRPLDGLRFLGALGIIVFHYTHFFSDYAQFPFYTYYSQLINNGWVLVELFFLISGITFMAFYSSAIHEKKINFYSFMLKRISRLMPLQWITLFIVAALQWGRMQYGFPPFCYNVVDFYAFVLNLLGVQAWNIYFSPSFNFVSWALSVELLLYVLFFGIVHYRRGIGQKIFFVAAIFIGFFIYRIEQKDILFVNTLIARGLIAFFVGGLLFELLLASRGKPLAQYCAMGSLLFTLAYCLMFGSSELARGGYISMVYVLVIFPALIVFSLNNRAFRYCLTSKTLLRGGEISFTMYMIHFPIQLIMKTLSIHFPISWHSKGTFFIYIGSVIIVSMFIFTYFEKPMLLKLRRKFSV